MTVLERLEKNRAELTEDIGEFKIIANSNNREFLIKNLKGFYFKVIEENKNSMIIEDVTWVANGILCKKKKKRFINKTGSTKGDIKN